MEIKKKVSGFQRILAVIFGFGILIFSGPFFIMSVDELIRSLIHFSIISIAQDLIFTAITGLLVFIGIKILIFGIRIRN